MSSFASILKRPASHVPLKPSKPSAKPTPPVAAPAPVPPALQKAANIPKAQKTKPAPTTGTSLFDIISAKPATKKPKPTPAQRPPPLSAAPAPSGVLAPSLRLKKSKLSSLKKRLLSENAQRYYAANTSEITVSINGYVQEGDVDDDEEYDEILEDLTSSITAMTAPDETLSDLTLSTTATTKPPPFTLTLPREPPFTITVTVPNIEVAQCIVAKFNDKLVSGNLVTAGIGFKKFRVIVLNFVDEECLEDDEEFEEVMGDLCGRVEAFGKAVVSIPRTGADQGSAFVDFNVLPDAIKCVEELGKVVLAGVKLNVALEDAADEKGKGEKPPSTAEKPAKRLPPKYAALVSIPKTAAKEPSAATCATTGTASIKPGENEEAETVAMEMIKTLHEFQERARKKDDEKSNKRTRRMVSGLRECGRGLRSNRVKMVFLAGNLEDYEAIDEKVLEIVNWCYERDVSLFRFLSKRRLGKAIKKTVKISVVAIENFEGAHDLHKKLRKLVGTF